MPFHNASRFVILTALRVVNFLGQLGPPLSYPQPYTPSMKLNLLARIKQNDTELIASFGTARLVRQLNGKFQLLGGSAADRTEAKEWCSLFLHEAVFVSAPPRVYLAAPTAHQFQRA